jgi:hypothetical protein
MNNSNESLLVGTWKLQSFVHVRDNGERSNMYGEHPDGYISYAADGRMSAIGAADGRMAPHSEPPTDAEQVYLQETMFAYAGTYVVDGNKVTHRVDISWNQSFTGTEQVRLYELAGDTLTITSANRFADADGRDGVLVAVWDKVKAPIQ